jgi:hypothetical protein
VASPCLILLVARVLLHRVDPHALLVHLSAHHGPVLILRVGLLTPLTPRVPLDRFRGPYWLSSTEPCYGRHSTPGCQTTPAVINCTWLGSHSRPGGVRLVTQTILGVTWSFDCKIAVVKVVIIFSTTPYLDVHLGLHHVQATQPRGLVPAVGTPLPGVRLVTRTALAVINRWCGCHSRVSDGPYILAINNWSFRVQNDVGKSANPTSPNSVAGCPRVRRRRMASSFGSCSISMSSSCFGWWYIRGGWGRGGVERRRVSAFVFFSPPSLSSVHLGLEK